MEILQPQADEVLRRIAEIKAYYDAWEAANGGAPLISRTMLAFTAGIDRGEDLDQLLDLLDQRGGILSRQGEFIRLSMDGIQTAIGCSMPPVTH